jgi:hypothetical protein
VKVAIEERDNRKCLALALSTVYTTLIAPRLRVICVWTEYDVTKNTAKHAHILIRVIANLFTRLGVVKLSLCDVHFHDFHGMIPFPFSPHQQAGRKERERKSSPRRRVCGKKWLGKKIEKFFPTHTLSVMKRCFFDLGSFNPFPRGLKLPRWEFHCNLHKFINLTNFHHLTIPNESI